MGPPRAQKAYGGGRAWWLLAGAVAGPGGCSNLPAHLARLAGCLAGWLAGWMAWGHGTTSAPVGNCVHLGVP